ncbi:hypothetical protein DIPPA_32927 [Diplonema papillatum]|nr:hypothetical protein DIPPA_32927 [Diplonema papillatum]
MGNQVCGKAIFADIWSEVQQYASPREFVSYREVCKIMLDSVELRMKEVDFLRSLLEDTCRAPPTGKLLDAFLPGVRMLGPHAPNEAPEKLKCKLEVALGFENMSLDMLGFTVCGMGTANEFCNNYLPVVWKLCVRGKPDFTDEERKSFLLTARAIRLVTSRLETDTRKVNVVRMGKGCEAHYDIVHQALVISLDDVSTRNKYVTAAAPAKAAATPTAASDPVSKPATPPPTSSATPSAPSTPPAQPSVPAAAAAVQPIQPSNAPTVAVPAAVPAAQPNAAPTVPSPQAAPTTLLQQPTVQVPPGTVALLLPAHQVSGGQIVWATQPLQPFVLVPQFQQPQQQQQQPAVAQSLQPNVQFGAQPHLPMQPQQPSIHVPTPQSLPQLSPVKSQIQLQQQWQLFHQFQQQQFHTQYPQPTPFHPQLTPALNCNVPSSMSTPQSLPSAINQALHLQPPGPMQYPHASLFQSHSLQNTMTQAATNGFAPTL